MLAPKPKKTDSSHQNFQDFFRQNPKTQWFFIWFYTLKNKDRTHKDSLPNFWKKNSSSNLQVFQVRADSSKEDT